MLKKGQIKKILAKDFVSSQSSKVLHQAARVQMAQGTSGNLNTLTSSATNAQLKKVSDY